MFSSFLAMAMAFFMSGQAEVSLRKISSSEGAGPNWPSAVTAPAWAFCRPASVSSATILPRAIRSEEHTSELQSRSDLGCRHLLGKKKKTAHYDDTMCTSTHVYTETLLAARD